MIYSIETNALKRRVRCKAQQIVSGTSVKGGLNSKMKTKKIVIPILTGLLSFFAAGTASAGTVSSLTVPGGTLTVGNLQFSNFSLGTVAGLVGIDPATVNVTGLTGASGFGLTFSGTTAPPFVINGAGQLVFDLLFDVTALDPAFLINGVQQSFNPTGLTNNICAFDFTTVGLHVASNNAGGGCPPSPGTNSFAVASTGFLAGVDRQVQLIGNQSGGAPAATGTIDTWGVLFTEAAAPPVGTSVPEPMTGLLFGGGLVALGLSRRSARR
jgi:hypothetical protein